MLHVSVILLRLIEGKKKIYRCCHKVSIKDGEPSHESRREVYYKLDIDADLYDLGTCLTKHCTVGTPFQ